jgi:hypothetical protein
MELGVAITGVKAGEVLLEHLLNKERGLIKTETGSIYICI